MKLLNRIFKGENSKTDHDGLESYYGHGAINHKRQGHSHGHEEVRPVTKFKCPMGCEGSKVYDSPGNCPVCNMKLVPVDYNSDEHI